MLYSSHPTVLNSRLLKAANAFMELEKGSTPVECSDIELSLGVN